MTDSNLANESSSNLIPAAPRKSRHPWLAAAVGTVAFVGVAGVGMQFLRAPEGMAQTANQPAQQAATATTQNNVLAKINNTSISYEALARQCVERHGEAVLENMINQTIIQQECQKRGITVTQADVEAEVATIAKKFNLPLDAWYQMIQSERGLTRQQYQADIIWPMIALKKLAGTEVQVTEQDMQTGFERDYGPRMQGRMIMIEGNSRQAAEVWEKCNAAPAEFDRIAREHSADPNTRPLGGVIPPVRRHGGNKQIEDAAFRLQPGEVSAVIQVAENRYVILKCEAFTDPIVTDIKTVWNDLYSQLVEEKTQLAVANVFTQIKEKAVVHNFLTRTTSGRPVTPASGGTQTATPIVPVGATTR